MTPWLCFIYHEEREVHEEAAHQQTEHLLRNTIISFLVFLKGF